MALTSDDCDIRPARTWDSERCHILFLRGEFVDATGCLKRAGHAGAHCCRTQDGTLMEWEYDLNCDCGCWADGDDGGCIVYERITNPNNHITL